ncbi:MAG: heavy metal-binding domain-containing protein [Cyanobacteria bacterium SID2]|nr:heavy metal-binding domain-containing protein [Cyanobacteria bacterium SID2]
MIVSSGGIDQNYRVLGLVVGFASDTEGCSGGIAVENTYQSALKRLMESASAQGANGLLYVNFQNRFAATGGCSGPKQAFEVFAWGTAVQLA